MRSCSALLLFLLPLALSGQDSDVEAAIADLEVKIDASLAEFQDIVNGISTEKLPLVQSISRLEQEIRNLEIELGSIEENARREDLQVADLRDEISAFESQTEYTEGILREYLNTFESRLHVAEDQLYADRLVDVREALETVNLDSETRADLLLRSIEMSLERLPLAIGGQTLESRALMDDGSLLTGQVYLIGPTAIFSSGENEADQGLLAFQPNSLEPNLILLNDRDRESIRDFKSTLSGSLPLDPTLGRAINIAATRTSIAEHIKKGGPVGAAILALGGFALLISLIKLWDLRPVSTPPIGALEKVATSLSKGETEDAVQASQDFPGVVSDMIQTGLRDGLGHIDQTEEIMLGVILKRKTASERFLPFLAMTAAAAPLLGLLGTVVGMIKTFTLITVFGSGDAKALSSGISEALITTELGLFVAIPALLLHGTFSRLVKNNLNTMETAAADLLLSWNGKLKEPVANE